ncbi:MAG: response regulator [Candidatus Riflebacteria bacterium]|nr:response regulator [Candidatus Riflebacteria bacterium]
MGKKILLVDDDVDFVNLNREILENAGYSVSFAYNGEEGMKAIKASKPDLLVLDVMMTTIVEGFDFADKLQEIPEFKDIPVIMLTGMTKTPQFPESFQKVLGRTWTAAAYLEKPVKPEKLVSEVKKILG